MHHHIIIATDWFQIAICTADARFRLQGSHNIVSNSNNNSTILDILMKSNMIAACTFGLKLIGKGIYDGGVDKWAGKLWEK